MLSRVACLGHDVHQLLYPQKQLVNQQKVRADLFLEWAKGATRPMANIVQPHMERQDIYGMIEQQEKLPWLETRRSSDIILMDSFAELTDQKFVHKKQGWAFTCNYTDLQHSDDFEHTFECHGLMDINDLAKDYDNFFAFVNKNFNGKKIVFFHFPTALDSRDKFKERGQAIIDAMEQMVRKYKNITHVHIEDSLVTPFPDDDFPYHYSKSTYQHLVDKLTEVNAGNKS